MALSSRPSSRISLREENLEAQLNDALRALKLSHAKSQQKLEAQAAQIQRQTKPRPESRGASELLGFDPPCGDAETQRRAASPNRMQVSAPKKFDPKPRVPMTGTRPRKDPNPFSLRGPAPARPSARPSSAAPFSARPAAARPTAARRTGGTTGAAFELPEPAPKIDSGKALEQEMARYAAYKVEQDKRSQGAGAREAIAAGRSANEDPSALVQYTMGEKIGAGAYACVRAAWVKESGDRVAVKVYEKAHLNRESRRRNVYREVHVLAKVRHKHIIGFREWFATDRHIYIVMEYVCGGSLQSLLRKQPASRFDDGTAKRLFAQVCEGIGYCHSLRVVHRDIKLDNVLLDRNCCVKIIDFGFAVAIPQGQKLKIFCGTPSYIAPEIISGQPYAFPGDVWALGVLLYVLLAGRFPFKASTQRELYRRIVRGSFQALEGCVPESRELIDAVLQKDQAARPTVPELLGGPWLAGLSSISSCSSLGGPVGSTATTATAHSFVASDPLLKTGF